MARPKPEVLMSILDNKTHISYEVLAADATYAVYYDGRPINLRVTQTLLNQPNAKYKKTSFPSPGHAHNLAEKLNKQFNTDKFEVYKLIDGDLATE